RIEDPCELAVLMRFRAFEDLDSGRLEAHEQLAEVIDAVVDHEGRVAGREPLGVPLGDVPDGEAFVLASVLRPPQHGAAPRRQRHPQVLLIPRRQCRVVPRALEEHAPDPGDFRHRSLLMVSGALRRRTAWLTYTRFRLPSTRHEMSNNLP